MFHNFPCSPPPSHQFTLHFNTNIDRNVPQRGAACFIETKVLNSRSKMCRLSFAFRWNGHSRKQAHTFPDWKLLSFVHNEDDKNLFTNSPTKTRFLFAASPLDRTSAITRSNACFRQFTRLQKQMTRIKINFENLFFSKISKLDVLRGSSPFQLTYWRVVRVQVFAGHELRHEWAFADLFAAQH